MHGPLGEVTVTDPAGLAAFIGSQRTENHVPHRLTCKIVGVSESWLGEARRSPNYEAPKAPHESQESHQHHRRTGITAPGRVQTPSFRTTWTPEDGFYDLCQVAPREAPKIRTGASSGPSKRYCRVFFGVSLIRPTLLIRHEGPYEWGLECCCLTRWKTSRAAARLPTS